MARRPGALLYAVDDAPPLATTIALGVQQVALMAIYLVMVVIVVRAAGASQEVAQSAVILGLIAMAVSTALQALRAGPMGSGYLAPPVISAIYAGGAPVKRKLASPRPDPSGPSGARGSMATAMCIGEPGQR